MKLLIRKIAKKIVFNLPVFGTYLKFRKAGFVDVDLSLWRYIRFRFFTIDKLNYWPTSKTCIVRSPRNIVMGINSVICKRGCYVQGGGRLIIGNHVIFATNIGVVTANHKLTNQAKHDRGVVEIGDYSWVGMNSVILPNVKLGPRTIVAAGSVVTKSFPEGFCVIGGNPAKKIKDINSSEFVVPVSKYEFYGWIPKDKFEKFKQKYLKKNTIYFPEE